MRLGLIAGLLGLGIGLGTLFGLSARSSAYVAVDDPFVEEYVRLVSVLYAKGESLALAEARLDRLGYADSTEVVRAVVARRQASGETTTSAQSGDLGSLLAALAPNGSGTSVGNASLAASGRGEGPTPAAGGETPVARTVAVPTPLPPPSASTEYPTTGRVSATQGDASLRTEPNLSAPIIRVIPRGSEILLLGIEQGQAIEGAEDRWYKVRHGDVTGYVYFTLVEKVR